MWDARTGKLLWKHDQLFLNGWKSYPGFTPDGQYVGFHDEDRIYLVHAYSQANSAIIPVDTTGSQRRLGLSQARPILAFAFANGGRRLAVAWRNASQPTTLTKSIASERPVDMISLGHGGESPPLCYSSDGTRIFMVYRQWRNKPVKKPMANRIVIVNCFDVTAPFQKIQQVRIDHTAVASYRLKSGLTSTGNIALNVKFASHLRKHAHSKNGGPDKSKST